MEQDKKFSCVHCATHDCDGSRGARPAFCVTAHTNLTQQAMDAYVGQDREIMKNAAAVEFEHYCQFTRLEETVAFAQKMGYHKLGIATCVGLHAEARIVARVLESHGFTVFGAACKVGAVEKHLLGVDPICETMGKSSCNPIMQAMLLNQEQTELNIVIGLCVGHDSLFYKHSQAPVTTLVVKDRVTGHNPVAAIYTADTYYKSKLYQGHL